MSNLNDVLEEIKDYSVCVLADLAGCDRPDWDSPGSRFLEWVRSEILERIKAANLGALTRLDFEYSSIDWAFEIAEQAPSDYTTERWLQFVDLGAYLEAPEEEWPDDLTDAAALALTIIAQRLIDTLLREIGDALDQGEDED
jgi:hypothetical protein